ncbi:DUF2703 domain-containing protein [Proteiniclasticum sediminis]|nr:DUF2703 domain-containing protein [Proteiniclasticum sediminis]
MNREIQIDFLYLDLKTCTRCQGTETNLDQAIREAAPVLRSAGYTIHVRSICISTPELAKEHRFLSSPTLRLNGHEIDLMVTETPCKDCGDLCGETVDCRTWNYQGIEHALPPKEMIINALLKEIYGMQDQERTISNNYALPENLKIFFEGLNGSSS